MKLPQARLAGCPNCGRKNRVPAVAATFPHCGNCHRPLPWIVDAGDDDFGDVAETAAIPVLVDMWATWCVPRRRISPALEQLARDLAGKVKLVKVNVDKAPRLPERFSVQAVPTLMLMRGRRIIAYQAAPRPSPRCAHGWTGRSRRRKHAARRTPVCRA